MKFLFFPLLISFWIFLLISKENELMEVRLLLPKKQKEISSLLERQRRYQVELDQTLSPPKLLEQLRTPYYYNLSFAEENG